MSVMNSIDILGFPFFVHFLILKKTRAKLIREYSSELNLTPTDKRVISQLGQSFWSWNA